MATNITIDETGIISPTTEEIREGFQSILINAFGTDINLDSSTPQGSIIDDLTEFKQIENSQLMYALNQWNPQNAMGVWQQALANLYFLKRKIATPSVVSCVCVGVPNTVLNGIASGNPAKAQSTSGDVFVCIDGGVIPSSGTITLQFQSEKTGKIPCVSHSVNKIYQSVIGWDSVDNPSSGTEGEEEESRTNFEERRKLSLATNATGSLASVYSKLYNVDGVTDVFVYENGTNEEITYRGATLSPHSIYTCINGGESSAIAEAIFNSKSAGCDTNGETTVTYIEPTTRVVYDYNIERPTDTDIYIKVSVDEEIGSDLTAQIKDLIVANFNGDDGKNPHLTMGDTVYASRFVTAIAGVDIQLINIKVGLTNSNWQDLVLLNVNQLPVLSAENISIEVV